MADVQRTVSTLLKVDGEAQYNAALKNVNREQASVRASARLLDEQFKGQANTVAALAAKQQSLSQQYDVASRKVELVKSRYEEAKKAIEKFSAETEALKARIASEGDAEGKLAEQLKTAQTNLQAAQNATVKYSGDVARAETEQVRLNNEIKQNSKYLDEAKNSVNGTAKSINEYGKEVAKSTKESEELGATGKEAFDQLAQALVAAGLAKSIQEIVDLFKQAAESSIEFESAFAGVLKTVEGSPEQLAQIKEELKGMSTEIPLTTTELAKIEEVAGQLGIATKDVTSFSRTMAALGVSTNLTSEQAATLLARFAKITGMLPDEFDNLGSVIVALGNNSAATESEIVDMAMGIAASGRLVGMTAPEIMAFAAALTSAGMESQAGGTAISRTLADISTAANGNIKDLEKYAEVAGMTAEQFAVAFKEDATSAFMAFVSGLSRSGDKAIAVLNDMGITEIRQRDALLRLSASGDSVTASINLANTAYAENNALNEEASKRYETTESKIQLLKNAVNLLGITIGDQMNPAVRNGTEDLTDMVLAINDFLEENPTAVQGITALAAVLVVLSLAVAGYVVVTKAAIPAIVAFNAALTANPIGLVVLALAALTAGLAAAALTMDLGTEKYEDQIRKNRELRDEMERTAKAYEENVSKIEAESDAVDGLIDRLDNLMTAQGGNKQNTAQIKNVVDQLNAAVSDLNLTYNETTGTLNMTTAAIRNQTDAMFQQALRAAVIDRQVEAYVELQEAQNNLTKTQNDLADAQAEYNAEVFWATDPNGNRFLVENARALALKGTIRELTKDEESQSETVDEQKESYKELTDSITGTTEATDDASDSVQGLTNDLDDAQKKAEAFSTAYDQIKKSVSDAADKVGEFGEKLDGAAKKNIDYYIKGEKSQKGFWDDYADNLKKAQELGLDEGLLSSLSAPTEENARILDSIVGGSVEKVQELNQAYKDNADARKEYVDQAAQAQADAAGLTEQFMDDIDNFIASMDQSDSAYVAGVNTFGGMLNGLKAKFPEFKDLINEMLIQLGKLTGQKVGSTSMGYLLSHKTGLDYVPYDDYVFRAHEGEAVLTKAEANSWRAMKSAIKDSTPSADEMLSFMSPSSNRRGSSGDPAGSGDERDRIVINSDLIINAPEKPDVYTISRLHREHLRSIKK